MIIIVSLTYIPVGLADVLYNQKEPFVVEEETEVYSVEEVEEEEMVEYILQVEEEVEEEN